MIVVQLCLCVVCMCIVPNECFCFTRLSISEVGGRTQFRLLCRDAGGETEQVMLNETVPPWVLEVSVQVGSFFVCPFVRRIIVRSSLGFIRSQCAVQCSKTKVSKSCRTVDLIGAGNISKYAAISSKSIA